MANVVVLLLSLVLLVSTISAYPSVSDDDELDEIVGGTVVARGTRPYMAHLLIPVNKFQIAYCGGTVLDATHILTAAHCVSPLPSDPIRVRLRVYRVQDPMDASLVEMFVDPKNIQVHENYVPIPKDGSAPSKNDIAILKLNKAINFDDCAKAVNSEPCLRIGTVNVTGSVSMQESRSNAWAVGWGLTSGGANKISPTMQEVEVKIIPIQQCGYNDDSKLCIAAVQGSKLTCQGDSGGPLLAGKTNIQIGITSFGDSRCSAIGVFTRVSYYVKNGWIKNNMK